MRTIKFRGLRTDGKGWVYGYYYEYSGKHIICWQNHSDNATTDYFAKVFPETVGQFTGLKDKNGNEIYENEIFKSKYDSLGNLLVNPVLMYEDLRWVLIGEDRNFEYLDYYETETELEIIGKIHENPEPLNSEKIIIDINSLPTNSIKTDL